MQVKGSSSESFMWGDGKWGCPWKIQPELESEFGLSQAHQNIGGAQPHPTTPLTSLGQPTLPKMVATYYLPHRPSQAWLLPENSQLLLPLLTAQTWVSQGHVFKRGT